MRACVLQTPDGSKVTDLNKCDFSHIANHMAEQAQKRKNLTADEKKAIGTIKRYGVGADVLIMVGGLSSA